MKTFDDARKALARIRTLPPPKPVVWLFPWEDIECPLDCKGTIYIDQVDEDYIEESGMNPDFVEGDNWLHDQEQKDHPPYVPDHHIFLSRGLFKIGMKKVWKTFAHELAELILMARGQNYDEAHPQANIVETELGVQEGAEE